MYTFFRVSPHHDFLVFHLPFHLLFSSLFSLLFSSLLFSSLLFFSLLLSFSFFLFLPFSFFFFLFLSSFSDNGTQSEKEFQQEPGPTDMSDGTRSTNICQKPFILSCFVLSSLASFSVFFLCLLSLSLSPCVGGVCVVVCVVVCVCVCLCGVVWCGTLKTPCVDSKRFPCVDSKRPRVCRQHAHMLFQRQTQTQTQTQRHRDTETDNDAHVWDGRRTETMR